MPLLGASWIQKYLVMVRGGPRYDFGHGPLVPCGPPLGAYGDMTQVVPPHPHWGVKGGGGGLVVGFVSGARRNKTILLILYHP